MGFVWMGMFLMDEVYEGWMDESLGEGVGFFGVGILWYRS